MAEDSDGRRRRGDRTRAAVLERSTEIASAEGLEGLSLGRLATEIGVSKSGVFALFGSKEELQVATVAAAREVFVATAVAPALEGPPGLPRLWHLTVGFADYASKPTFAGGCFFHAAAAEFDSRPGPVRDAIAAALTEWQQLHVDTIEEAKRLGEIADDVDGPLLAFELLAFANAANADALLHDDPHAFDLARAAAIQRLRSIATDPDQLPSGAHP